MTDRALETAGSPPADVIAYLADMLSQLARLATSVDEHELARAIAAAADQARLLQAAQREGRATPTDLSNGRS